MKNFDHLFANLGHFFMHPITYFFKHIHVHEILIPFLSKTKFKILFEK